MTGFWTYWGRLEENNGYKETFGVFTEMDDMWHELRKIVSEKAYDIFEFRDWLESTYTSPELFMKIGDFDGGVDSFINDLFEEFLDEFYQMRPDSPKPVEGEDYIINGHVFKWVDTGEFKVHGRAEIW